MTNRVKLGGKSEQRYKERVGRVKETPCSCQKTLPVNHEPHGNT